MEQKASEHLENEHWSRVIDARGDLWESLKAAKDDLENAMEALRKLSSGDAWDVEYECVREFQNYLHETRRLLIITRALMPTANDCTTNTDKQLNETVRALMNESHIK